VASERPDAACGAGQAAGTCAASRLESYVQVFDDALSADFCAKMIESFAAFERFHVANGRGHRAGLERSAWCELNVTPLSDVGFRGFFVREMDAYLARYNERLGLTIPVPWRPRIDDLCIKRYRANAGECFQPHFDALDEKAGRYLVFLWYLNSVEEGGETEFCQLGLRVAARAGRLLMFPPYWMFQHAGLAPRSNDKYIISTYLMF
jgi:hypothetical protein